jgi:hypothetical protein
MMPQRMTARFQPCNREWFGSDEDLGDDDDVLDDSDGDGDASVTSNSSDSVNDSSCSDAGGPDSRMDIEFLVDREQLNNIDHTNGR